MLSLYGFMTICLISEVIIIITIKWPILDEGQEKKAYSVYSSSLDNQSSEYQRNIKGKAKHIVQP